MYIHLKTYCRFVYLNCIKHPTLGRLGFTIAFSFTFWFFWILVSFFRLLDELFFRDYRKVRIEKPVFIIGNPRGGTSFLYDLLAIDQDKFAQPLLYQSIFCSVTFYKVIEYFRASRRKARGPLRWFFSWFNRFFGQFGKIHKIGLDRSEEDVPFSLWTFLSPVVYLLCPFLDELNYLRIIDHYDEGPKKKWARHYRRCIQIFLYVYGDGRRYLNKNVLMSGKILTLKQIFPDARIIYAIRHPYMNIPSGVSFFNEGWKLHSRRLRGDTDQSRAVAKLLIDSYLHVHTNEEKLGGDFSAVKFKDLIQGPEAVVDRIYREFEIEMSQEYRGNLRKHIHALAEDHKSQHTYSLDDFGLTKEEIYRELKPIFEKYEFDK